MKTPLKKVLGCSYGTFEELSTILTEIEAVINSRPLTYVATDSDEPEPLTPAHFLVGRRLISLSIRRGEPTVPSSDELTRHWRYRERLLDFTLEALAQGIPVHTKVISAHLSDSLKQSAGE